METSRRCWFCGARSNLHPLEAADPPWVCGRCLGYPPVKVEWDSPVPTVRAIEDDGFWYVELEDGSQAQVMFEVEYTDPDGVVGTAAVGNLENHLKSERMMRRLQDTFRDTFGGGAA